MKLNLGCGERLLQGYCNVDKYGNPDLFLDLEIFPWPWDDETVEEVILSHVLEHLGQRPDQFIGIMKELYRVCQSGAVIRIVVPHPRHDFFIMDPTHVRAITPNMMAMFSKKRNREWQAGGMANTPLALYHDVDFDLQSHSYTIEEPYLSQLRRGELTLAKVTEMERTFNNVASEIEMTLRVVK